MQQLAYHDHLTALPNRLMFTEQLRRALARARRQKRRVGILFIDLDGFKNINDELGHQAGDRVLKEIGRRLISCVRQEDTAARFGGDEFAILLDEIQDRASLASLAARILKEVGRPISLGNQPRSVGASIGISAYPEDAKDLAQLMKQADLAMYEAKARGKNRSCFFSDLKKAKGF
jgi:diguanylate cyclase (GGDEF)-like protein